jgi:hypothetical protein
MKNESLRLINFLIKFQMSLMLGFTFEILMKYHLRYMSNNVEYIYQLILVWKCDRP